MSLNGGPPVVVAVCRELVPAGRNIEPFFLLARAGSCRCVPGQTGFLCRLEPASRASLMCTRGVCRSDIAIPPSTVRLLPPGRSRGADDHVGPVRTGAVRRDKDESLRAFWKMFSPQRRRGAEKKGTAGWWSGGAEGWGEVRAELIATRLCGMGRG